MQAISDYGPVLDELREAANHLCWLWFQKKTPTEDEILAALDRLANAVSRYDRAKLALDNAVHAAAMTPAPGD